MNAGSWTGGVSLFAVLLVSSCADELPPNHHQLRSDFQDQLPIHYELSSFHVGRYKRFGRGDTASFQAPLQVIVRARTNLYTVHSWLGDTYIVNVSSPQGRTQKLTGTVVFHRDQEWKTTLNLDLGVIRIERPSDSLAASQILIKGSAEEQQWSRQHQYAMEREQRRRQDRILALTSVEIPGLLMVDGRSQAYRFTIRFYAYEPRDESITGQISFPSLRGAVKEFRGRIAGDDIFVQENSWSVRPRDTTGIVFGNRYQFHLSGEGRITSGAWQHPQLRGSLQFW